MSKVTLKLWYSCLAFDWSKITMDHVQGSNWSVGTGGYGHD